MHSSFQSSCFKHYKVAGNPCGLTALAEDSKQTPYEHLHLVSSLGKEPRERV